MLTGEFIGPDMVRECHDPRRCHSQDQVMLDTLAKPLYNANITRRQ